MKGMIQIIIGLLLFVIVLLALTESSWLWATIQLIQGGIIILLFLIGLGLIIFGASELKE